ncbi:RNA polymerase sigma factor [Asticcacaulis sp. BYS171W]|uniref:RNA polymerase sigma factor n=1 Tax=Asticcacaulis aquaticus TaxID=2984212 RepID=A0ABT5HW07_9CAUL|nr:RNA polymerase sigma factor [Asticcacaulis aquaticus]MDC7684239.1 RNA polymerase sigma factor [Asticcacaulis aquaticus]
MRDIDRWFCAEISPYESQYTALAMRLTGTIDNARDLVHDAYAQVLSQEKWRQIDNPRAYVMRTIYNLGLNSIRRARVVSMQQLADADAITQVDISPDAFDTFSDREELGRVLAAVEQLPPQCRKVVVMRRIEDLPPREVARRLNLSLSTVEKHLARGLVLLADLLDAEPEVTVPLKTTRPARMTSFQAWQSRLLRR